MDPRRADLAPAGAVLLDTILEGLGADEITLCDFALREGLVLDYIKRNAAHIRTVDRYPDVRRRSVIELAERCNYWPAARPAGRAARARALRRHPKPARPRPARARVARVRRAAPRHRHAHRLRAPSQALVLPDSPRRTARIRAGRGRVDRAHRPLSPAGHAQDVSRGVRGAAGDAARDTVRLLSAFVRLAEGLDRSHAQVVKRVRVGLAPARSR